MRAQKAVVLVEGTSDRLAVETLASRLDRDLAGEGISVIPIGGAQAIGKVLARYGPQGLDVRLAGLCDAAEEGHFKRALERAGLGPVTSRDDLERLGFYVCEDDLEDELVRALGYDRLEKIIEEQGETSRFHTFQKQLAKRGLSREQQLYGFMWNRKIRYAPLLVDALDLERVPRPLERLLAHV
jgi:predicted ATP-dependent endonuclease of OLD family